MPQRAGGPVLAGARSYLSQSPPTLHFGLGADRIVHRIEVRWPGPGGDVSRVENVPVDQRLTIEQPVPDGFRLNVVGGSGGGIHAAGARVFIEPDAAEANYRFSHWSSEGGGRFADARSRETTFTMPDGPVTVFARFLPVPPPSRPTVSVARLWIEVALQAIRNDFARPTVYARNLFHISAAMYDAWATYSGSASPYSFGDGGTPCGPSTVQPTDSVRSAQEEAISYAASRLIRHRFRLSPNAARVNRDADTLLAALGYEAGADSADPAVNTPSAVGDCLGALYVRRGFTDGSNEANNYRSLSYRSVNPYLDPSSSGNSRLHDPDRWQPLRLHRYIDQAGLPGAEEPDFLTPEWGRVAPFALSEDDLTIHRRGGTEYYVYHDPGPPPTVVGPMSNLYKWGFSLVARWSSHLSPNNGVLMDISPAGLGNVRSYPRTFDAYADFYGADSGGSGHDVNPATGQAYDPQWVPWGDYARVLAEFWADGPDSETPPGHWFAILNTVNDHDRHVRRFAGKGPELGVLE